MDDVSDRFTEALTGLGNVADTLTPDEAQRAFDEVTLQVFWREWPHVSSWAGSLWRRINEDLADSTHTALGQRRKIVCAYGGGGSPREHDDAATGTMFAFQHHVGLGTFVQ